MTRGSGRDIMAEIEAGVLAGHGIDKIRSDTGLLIVDILSACSYLIKQGRITDYPPDATPGNTGKPNLAVVPLPSLHRGPVRHYTKKILAAAIAGHSIERIAADTGVHPDKVADICVRMVKDGILESLPPDKTAAPRADGDSASEPQPDASPAEVRPASKFGPIVPVFYREPKPQKQPKPVGRVFGMSVMQGRDPFRTTKVQQIMIARRGRIDVSGE